MTLRFSRLPFLLLTVGGAACSKPQEPPADLTFVAFAKKEGEGDHYDLTFTSNIDFYSPDWTAGKRADMTPKLVCSLDDDTNFSTEHILRRSLSGYVEPSEQQMDRQTQYPYTLRVQFRETWDEGKADRYLRSREISHLLAKRTAIPCKVTRTFYFSLTASYYSKTMYVPVKALLEKVNK